MDRNDVSWQGYWPACPTPFAADGSFDEDSLRALLDYYLGVGVHGVLINGTTGEWFSQTPDERRLVAETALQAVAGRVPVVIGCTSYTADEVASFARHAIDAGASGVESLNATTVSIPTSRSASSVPMSTLVPCGQL